MASYALANANSLNKQVLMSKASAGKHTVFLDLCEQLVLPDHKTLRYNLYDYNMSHTNETCLNECYPDRSHWPVPGSSSFTLEASSYALLALVKLNDHQNTAPIVNWLNNQRQYNGGYGTTQVSALH